MTGTQKEMSYRFDFKHATKKRVDAALWDLWAIKQLDGEEDEIKNRRPLGLNRLKEELETGQPSLTNLFLKDK